MIGIPIFDPCVHTTIYEWVRHLLDAIKVFHTEQQSMLKHDILQGHTHTDIPSEDHFHYTDQKLLWVTYTISNLLN